jgi:hypothetical protein
MFLGHMLIHRDGRWQLCRGAHPDCDAARSLRERLVVLRQDLARGQQHALAWLDFPDLAMDTDMKVEKPYADCQLDVQAWGPQAIVRGRDFNRQPDGRSTFWFQLAAGRGLPKLRIGDDIELPMTVAGRSASAGLTPAQLELLHDGDELAWVCADGSSGSIGRLAIADGASPVPRASVAPVADEAQGCRAGLRDFGPREVSPGETFNVQPDGRSAIWLALAPGSRGFSLRVGGEPVVYFLAGDVATFNVGQALAESLSRPGSVPLELLCDGQVEAAAAITVGAAGAD